MGALFLALLLAQAQGDMAVQASGTLEARPAAAQASPLQARIDAARPGDTIHVEPGTYTGDIYIDKPIRLVGRGRPVLAGSGAGSVVRVRAAGVVIEGFDVDGREGGDLGRDSSGIHVAAHTVTIRDCRVVNSIFGIYLREADGARVERCRITGIRGKTAGEKGSGIHVWNTDGFVLADNTISDVRDGLYIQSSPHGTVVRNVAKDLRYGLHYMYSDDNVFEDNRFENGAAGTTIMYSRRIAFRRNQLVRNRGFASVGLLFKSCDDILAEDNLLADNARGIFIEGSSRTTFRRNVIAGSDVAIVLYDSTVDTTFTGNSFVANLAPLMLVGRRTATTFTGNYWSENDSLDLDGDGVTDQPYRLSSLFDHLRGNLLAADLLSRSLAAATVAAAERTLPVLEPVPVVDPQPLARAPVLPDVPVRQSAGGRAAAGGVLASGAMLLAGLLPVVAGRRRRARRSRRSPLGLRRWEPGAHHSALGPVDGASRPRPTETGGDRS